MKLQKLIIENIASIEKACIDFADRREPASRRCWMRCVWHSIIPLRV